MDGECAIAVGWRNRVFAAEMVFWCAGAGILLNYNLKITDFFYFLNVLFIRYPAVTVGTTTFRKEVIHCCTYHLNLHYSKRGGAVRQLDDASPKAQYPI